MRALTIKQPWAQRILYEGKRIENRSWPTHYRGPLVIHTGVRIDRRWPESRKLPKGALGVVRLIGVHEYDASVLDSDGCRPRGCAQRGGEMRPGTWHWEFDVAIAFPEPIPCAGRLGIWDPPERVALVASALIDAHGGEWPR
jgi:hypothetical protein